MFTAKILLWSALACSAPLPKLEIEPDSVTVSGVSSGAFMAAQLQVALSSRIHGLGSVAGGIYACAEGGLADILVNCTRAPGRIDPADSIEFARRAASIGRIDPLENLSRARAYLFHSEADVTVGFDALSKLKTFVETFTPPAQVKTVTVKNAAHAFPTKSYGEPCAAGGPPYLVRCGLDVAGEILAQLYPGLEPPAAQPTGDMLAFDQPLYSDVYASLLPQGYVYVPKACRTGACRLHVALHGCKMNQTFIGNVFRAHAGYNEWADTNRIVVLYPSADSSLLNQNACWDWFGATGPNYATKDGPQIRFISRVLKHFGV